jgi:hypothetical protein
MTTYGKMQALLVLAAFGFLGAGRACSVPEFKFDSGNAGSGGGAYDASCGNECAAGQVCCAGNCTDVGSDTKNCGDCGVSCPNTACLGGQCTGTCVIPFENCDQNMVLNGCEADLRSDPKNCGGCATECPAGAECSSGVCQCPAGYFDCDGLSENGCEADLANSTTHCGACGSGCTLNEACTGGTCACADGFGDCNANPEDGCEAPLDTTQNCGTCGTSCAVNMACQGGSCACAPGFLDCNDSPGCETSAKSPSSCGACGTLCPTGMLCDGVSCVESCALGATACSGSCVDTKSDPAHCGACGAAVGPNQQCEAGVPICSAGWDDCSAAPGCETAVSNDVQNCGACGEVCKPGAICIQGECKCPTSLPKDCGVACRVCCANSDCSDGIGCTVDVCSVDGMSCSNSACAPGTQCCNQLACQECCTSADCGSGQTCSGGVCSAGCPAGQLLCAGKCVDPTSDPNNCGACGTRCGDGTCACKAGQCTGGTIYFSDDFSDLSKGWTRDAEWEIGPAKASTGHVLGHPDPATDRSPTDDNGVAGVVIGGNFMTGKHSGRDLRSPSIDLSAAPGTVKLTFWRWLNGGGGGNQTHYVYVWTGSAWTSLLWATNLITDNGWARFEHDVTQYKSADFRLRFGFKNPQLDIPAMSGWNLDDVTVSSATCE